MTRSHTELLDITKQLISIESTAQNPQGLKEALEVIIAMIKNSHKAITVERFRKNGTDSLLAYSGGERPHNFRIMLNGHLDVVPGKPAQFQPYIKDGKLYGRGAYDMKAAIVILAELFCEYVDKVPYALGFQISTDEESGGHNCTAYQIAQGVRADFVICGECGRSEQTYELANEAKGVAVINLEFDGRSAHGAYLWNGDNAILRATNFAHALLKYYPIPTEAEKGTTVNVSNIGTNNTALTTVPDHASLRLEIRFTNDDRRFRSRQHMTAFLEQIDPGVRISSIPVFDAPIYTSPKNTLLTQLKQAAEKAENHRFNLVRRNGSSDGRHYANVGDQACEFGIAGEGSHSDNEYITIQAFKNYHKTMEYFLAQTIKTEMLN